MSNATATEPTVSPHRLGPIVLWIALLLVGVVVALQGGWTPRPPAAEASADVPVMSIVLAQSLSVLFVFFDALTVLVPVVGAAMGFGLLCRRGISKEAAAGQVVPIALGLATLALLTWALAWAGALGGIVAWLLCGAGWIPLIVAAVGAWRRGSPIVIRGVWPIAATGPVIGLLLTACACPPGLLWAVEAYGYDVLSYHLQMPREWLDAGRMSGQAHNVYSYLPSLGEALFMLLGAMRGSMHDAIYAAQLLHALTGVLAAVAAGRLVSARFGATAGVVTGGVLLATPWTVICGSSAYNELFALAFGASALCLIDGRRCGRGDALGAGGLLGAATLAKLTAGPMIAVPSMLLLAVRSRNAADPRRATLLACAAAAMLLVMAPYFVRNAAWTGNPVFPFATGVFGRAHWTAQQAEVWSRVHAARGAWSDRLARIAPQWLTSVGYGAIPGGRSERRGDVVEQFTHRGAVPVLWSAALVAFVVILARGDPGARFGGAMVFLLLFEMLFWLAFTMQPSRYLYMSVLPASVLVGAACGRAPDREQGRIGTAAGVLVMLALTAVSFGVFHRQVRVVAGESGPVRLLPWQVVDAMESAGLSGHVLNDLPEGSRVYVVADATMLYVRTPTRWCTAWDIGPLGAWVADDEGEVTNRLRSEGFTHVWVNWSELARIRRTIGVDDGLDETTLRRVATRQWRAVQRLGFATLYVLR